MKKIKVIVALLLSASLILSFASCSDSYKKDETSTGDVSAANYISSPEETFELLKPLYAEHGYDFDTWNKRMHSGDGGFSLSRPYTSITINSVNVTDDSLFIRIAENDNLFLRYSSDSGEFLILTMSYENQIHPYDICDAILANCPDEYKLNGEYLRTTYSNVVEDGTATWNKNGLEYRLTLKETNPSPVYTFTLSTP